uniref:Uncharacterized protein n=1 Tax=Arundo donax TaxID=35708 RepID=A0A0A9F1H5_ARUDO
MVMLYLWYCAPLFFYAFVNTIKLRAAFSGSFTHLLLLYFVKGFRYMIVQLGTRKLMCFHCSSYKGLVAHLVVYYRLEAILSELLWTVCKCVIVC